MTSVYVVTTGCYSDYRIEGVFSTGEKAKEFISATGIEGDGEIETWILDAHIDKTERGYNFYTVKMRRDGNVVSIGKETPLSARHWITGGRVDCLYTSLWARDKEHAVKIANEQRARIIALGLWKIGEIEIG
jgi:hypothetical protein